MLPEDNWWLKALVFGIFAAFGGLMGHLMRTIDARQKIKWGRAFLEGAAAGFVGLLAYLLCQALGMSDAWTGLTVGVLGWLGAKTTIKILEAAVLKKLGIEKPIEPVRERSDDQPSDN